VEAVFLVVGALGLGVLPAWAAVRLSRGLRDMPAAATLTRSALLGTQGVVVSAVPSPGYGDVRLLAAGRAVTFAARSDTPLRAGTPVFVVEALSDTAVQVVSTALDPLPETGGPSTWT
jgi:membrane protein implicated in regulation of membrane protease activity